MTALAAASQTVGNAIWLQLGGEADKLFVAGEPNLFRGHVTQPPANEDGSVENYAVLYSGPGQRFGSRLGSARDSYLGTFQVTCVGADDEACLWTVDRITDRLSGKQIATLEGGRMRRIVEDLSNQARTVLVDENVDPPRHYVPLLFRISA